MVCCRLTVSTAPVGADRIRPKTDETELFVEWQQLPTRTVGADSIRPQHKAPLRGACVPGRLLVDPTGRMRSTGHLRKSGISGGFYPPLQSVWEAGTIQRAARFTDVSGRLLVAPTGCGAYLQIILNKNTLHYLYTAGEYTNIPYKHE